MKEATKVIHEGQPVDLTTNAIMPPVYFTSTYYQNGVGNHKGFDYSRGGHPNRQHLETALSSLEKGRYGLVFASGCAATTAVLGSLSPGDHVLSSDTVYGGTYALFTQLFTRWGLTFSFFKSTDSVSDIRRKITAKTKLIWIETPANPTLQVFSLPDCLAAKGKRKIKIVVDNTFATPILQRPLTQGADVVVHSSTKYIGGHSDLIGGALVCNDKKLYEAYHFYLKSTGAIPGPMDCYLAHRGLKTLAIRMQAHCDNAEYLVEELKKYPKISQVYYPGFDTKGLAENHMSRAGGVISIELKRGCDSDQFFKRLKLFRLAESLGGVESLISLPYAMSHVRMPVSIRKRLGVTSRLIRLSVGIEDKHDLRDDLNTALKGL